MMGNTIKKYLISLYCRRNIVKIPFLARLKCPNPKNINPLMMQCDILADFIRLPLFLGLPSKIFGITLTVKKPLPLLRLVLSSKSLVKVLIA